MQPLILIIDDDASIRHSVGEILSSAGYRIAHAENVQQGIAALQQLSPDLVLSDVIMPDGNGYDVLNALQKMDKPMTPFIFMSGEAILTEDIRRGMRSGADDYLLKPFRVQDLLETVAARLERQQQLQATLQRFQNGPNLPEFLNGGEPALLLHLQADPPTWLLSLQLDHYERFQRSFGREGARLLCYSVFQRLKNLPELQSCDFYASESPSQLYILPRSGVCPPTEQTVHAAIQAAFAEPVPFDRYQLHLHASLGWVYQDSEHPLLPEDWLDRANLALYQSRLLGGGAILIYQPQMATHLYEHLHWEDELQTALNDERFELWYQPQYDLKNSRIVAAEALLRLRHPEYGLIPPGDFIPVAEDSGLIVPIGTWVLRRACQTLTSLRSLGLGQVRMAVNVSLLQFQTPGFILLVSDILRETETPGQQLELELTESLLISNFRQIQQLIQELKDSGLTLAVDDFGTGYSSLFYIHQLPFDTLKIDQSFVRQMQRSAPQTLAIPRAIIEMGHGMGMKVLAEGIETEEQLQLLRELGCDQGQGYLLARPMPQLEFQHLLQCQEL